MQQLVNDIILRRWKDEASLVKHVSVHRNQGVKGGFIRSEFYTHPGGDPTGVAMSEIVYPPAQA